MKYNIIYADPPWLYNKRDNPNTKFGIGMHRYKGMTLQELIDMKDFINKLAAENCALFMWHVPPMFVKYPIGTLFDAWGFRYVSKAFTWIKIAKFGAIGRDLTIPRYLPGHYTGSNSEDCFLGIKGKMPVVNKGVNQVILSQLEEHSRKPAEARERIVQLFGDVPRIELFARERVKGWDAWGKEI